MKLERSERIERAVLVGQSSAIGIAVGAVRATIAADVAPGPTAGAGEVAAAAASCGTVTLKCIAVCKVAIVLGIVLARREQRAELQAIPDRRLVPDRVVHAPIEFGPVVAPGVAHDRIVIPERSRERI